jgi:predicted ATPase
VTLTGPGGTGKTRLALQAAAEVADDHPEGVWWVPLASFQDPTMVLPSILELLQLQNESGLAGKRLLVLLDNAEHLLPAIADSVAAIHAISGPQLVVTSRERLALHGGSTSIRCPR